MSFGVRLPFGDIDENEMLMNFFLSYRGTMLSYIFSMQGWGSFMGSLATIVVLAIYKNAMEGENGKISKVDGGMSWISISFL
jgi:hypothetical protein